MSSEYRKDNRETRLNSKTAKVLGLFMAAVLAVAPGCSGKDAGQAQHVHYDKDGDGLCDLDGQPMNSSNGTAGGGMYYGRGLGGYGYGLPDYKGNPTGSSGVQSGTSGASTGVSDGVSGAKGGIGSSSTGAGG